MPGLGDSFQLFGFNTITGSFDTIDAFALDNGLGWDFSQLESSGTLSVIPEPSCYALGISFVGLALALHRRWKTMR